jgi:hypothetical protein
MRKNINREDLVDINDIKIDPNLPQRQRYAEYMRQTNYRNRVLCNGLVVNYTYSKNGPSMEDCLKRVFA